MVFCLYFWTDKNKRALHTDMLIMLPRISRGRIDETVWIRREFQHGNEENIPAQEGYQEKGTRLYEENVHQERKKGSCKKKSQGQSKTFLLIAANR